MPLSLGSSAPCRSSSAAADPRDAQAAHDASAPVLEVRAATFSYRRPTLALDGVDLVVRRGEMVALLGHNGSGKSTLLRAAFDLLRLRSGSIALCGTPSTVESAKTAAVLLSGNDHVPTFLTGRELVALLATMYATTVDPEALDEHFALYGMDGRQDDLIEDYSHGMRKKTQLIAALLLRRPLTVVDETLNGVDREALELAEEDLVDLAADGAVVLCSHDLGLLERVATRAVVLDRGRVVADLDASEVRAAHGSLSDLLQDRAARR